MQKRHLVGHEEKALLGSKSDDILNALSALDLTCQQGGRLEKAIQRAGVYLLPPSGHSSQMRDDGTQRSASVHAEANPRVHYGLYFSCYLSPYLF